ncbi:MAG TPA: PAS domain-containing protein, partial [Variovorax sp.]
MSAPEVRSEIRSFVAQQQRRARARRSLPPEVLREREIILGALSCIVDMLGAMIGNHIEVVLHDLTRPESSILQIANG